VSSGGFSTAAADGRAELRELPPPPPAGLPGYLAVVTGPVVRHHLGFVIGGEGTAKILVSLEFERPRPHPNRRFTTRPK
jgi:hypothetical protein